LSLIIPVKNGTEAFINNIIPETVNAYPKDLEISIKDGVASTNVQEPYIITLPNAYDRIVIDTLTSFNQEQFDSYNAIGWLARDSIYFRTNHKGEIRGIDLKQVGNFKINRNLIDNFIRELSPIFKIATPVILTAAFIGIYFIYLLRLFQILILALLIYLILRVMKIKSTYGNSYKVALHAITLGLIIEAFLSISHPIYSINGFPFMTTLLTVLVVVANYKSRKLSAKRPRKK